MNSLADLFGSDQLKNIDFGMNVSPEGKYLYGDGQSGPSDEEYVKGLRTLYKIPPQASDAAVKQWGQTQLSPLIEANRKSGSAWDQFKEFAGVPLWMGSMAIGGPVAGTIAAANGSGATQSLGIDPAITTLAALAYGGYNHLNSGGLGSTPNADVAGSEYGAVGTAPVKPDYWSNTYAANDTGTMNDATGVQPAGEPPMWDWLDSIDPSAGFDPGAEGMWNPPAPGVGDAGAFDQTGSLTGATDGSFNTTNDTIFGGTSNNPFGNTSILDTLKQYGGQGLTALKSLSGGNGGGSGGKSTGGGILDTFLNNPMQAAFNSAPFLLAMNEANKQSGDLNGVLNNINGDAYTKSVLNPYDKETGQGRYAMQNDQALRGVSGSSFGDQALGGYDYTRALGRSDMASKAQLASAGLQGNLINARNTNRNLLLGAGLNASGSLFKPQVDPFNLRALLGV